MTLGELIVKILGDDSQFAQTVEGSEKKLKSFADSAGKIGKTLTKNVTVPLIAVAGAITAAVIETGRYADKILDLQQITGLSTDSLQEFEQVARVAGVSFDGLTNSIVRFSARLPQIRSEGTEVSKAFTTLGVSLEDTNGQVRDMEELFPELLESLMEIENLTERNAIAQQIFGRSLGDLAPVLGMTSAEFRAAREEAHELGLVLGKESLQAANQNRVAIENLTAQVKNLWREFSISLMPVIEDTIIPMLRDLLGGIRNVAEGFGNLDDRMKRMVIGAGAVLAAAGPTVLGIKAISGALLFLAANPIVLAIAGIGALAGVVAMLVTRMREVKEDNQSLQDQADILQGTKIAIDGITRSLRLENAERIKRLDMIRAEHEAELLRQQDDLSFYRDRLARGIRDPRTGAFRGLTPQEAAETRKAIELLGQDIDRREKAIESLTATLEDLRKKTQETSTAIADDSVVDTYTAGQKRIQEAHDAIARGLLVIREREKFAIARGEEYDAALARRELVLAEINKLIDERFNVEGEGIQFILGLYGDLLEATEELMDAEEERAEREGYWHETRQAQWALEARLKNDARQDTEDLAAAEARAAKDAIEAWNDYVTRTVEAWKRAHEEKLRSTAEFIGKLQSMLQAAARSIEASGPARAIVNTFADAAASIAMMFGPKGMVIGAVIQMAKSLVDIVWDMAEGAKRAMEEIEHAIRTISNRIELERINQARTLNRQLLDAELERINQAEAAELRSLGLLKEARSDATQKRIEDLQAELDRTRNSRRRAALQAQIAELEQERQRALIVERYEKQRIEARDAAAAAERRIARDQAELQRDMALAQLERDRAAAIGALKWWMRTYSRDKADLNAKYDALAATLRAQPLPSLAAGGVVMPRPGGTMARLAEAGVPEIVLPLDRLEEVLARRPTVTSNAIDEGDIRLVVNIDSKPILEKIFPATRNRTILISAGAVV